MKWNFALFFAASIAILCILGAIGFYSQKDNLYKPSLEKYINDTDRLKEICERLMAEQDPVKMNKFAMSLQISRAVSCNEYNGECRAFFDFLTEAVKSSSNDQFTSGYELVLRDKYEVLIHAIENGKLKLRK